MSTLKGYEDRRWGKKMPKHLPLGFLRVACDEVAVHVEESDPQQVEDDVESVSQRHRLVVGLPEGCEGALLWTRKERQADGQ